MHRCGGTKSTRRVGRRGFTIVEVMIAAAVLVIAISGLVGALVGSTSLGRVNRESALAEQAARRVLEELQGVPFAEVFATYNASTDDDAGLAVAARGSNFVVVGLDADPNDADGFCGEVIFPVIDVAGTMQLREDVVDGALGMPRDLNGSGAVDTADHAGDYRLLPVRIRVAWRGVSGSRAYDLETLVCTR